MSGIKISTMGLGFVPIRQIDASDRLRPVDPAQVQLIADSILASRQQGGRGLDTPIILRPCGEEVWKLVAGAHRLAAAQLLGDVHIDAIVQDMNELQARLVEIDENLCRAELNALDRAAFLADRDRIWREMNPDKVGSKGSNKARWHRGTDQNDKLSFGAEAAEKIGLSQRSIQRDVKIFRMLSLTPEVIDQVRGTWLEDNQQQLKALAAMPAAERGAVLDLLFRGEAPAKNVGAAIAEMRGHREAPVAPDEKAFAGLVTQWTRASAKTRGRFLDYLHSAGALDDYITGSED
jgi:ParB family chromosome partitioning protein